MTKIGHNKRGYEKNPHTEILYIKGILEKLGFNSINVLPVCELLNSFKNKNSIRKFIYFSTVQIYGKLDFKIIDEDTKPQPQNQYALTHLMAENIINYYNKNVKLIEFN